MSFLKLVTKSKHRDKHSKGRTSTATNPTLADEKLGLDSPTSSALDPPDGSLKSYQEIVRTSTKRRGKGPSSVGSSQPSSLRKEALSPLTTDGLSPHHPPPSPGYSSTSLGYGPSLYPHPLAAPRPSHPALALPLPVPPSSSQSPNHTSARSSSTRAPSSTSPTSPTSPTTPASSGTGNKAAHYYPYTASSRHGGPGALAQPGVGTMESPGSFRTRGSEAVKEREQERERERDRDGRQVNRQPTLPPGAQPPKPPESVRSHPSYQNLSPPPRPPAYPRARSPAPPPPPALLPPQYHPYPHAPYPPPHSPAPHHPYPTPPPSSFAPSPPHVSPYYHPSGPASSSAANAVARNIERAAAAQRDRERERRRAAEGGAGAVRPREGASGREARDGKADEGKKDKENAEGKLSVGIDFGTTFSGIAYGSSRLFAGQSQIRQILSWPGSYETYRKVPTCILYEQHSPDEEAKIVSWGLEAKNATVGKGLIKCVSLPSLSFPSFIRLRRRESRCQNQRLMRRQNDRCEWFKLLLSPESLRSGVPDPWLPPLPAGKNVVDVIADFLRCIWRYAKRQITEEIGSVVDLNAADVLLTVPSGWDAAACSLMRESAIRAGLVQSSRGGDVNWRDRLQIITEPEAGAIHASTLATLHHLRPSQCFLLCDAGGGTVDTAVYKLMGQLSELEIAEIGANTGSLFVDLKFEELLRRILKDHPIHLEPASMATFLHSFSETDKVAYHGTKEDDDAIFRFNCFNVEDSHDPAVGLEFGELAIPGHVLKTEVFDPVIEQVLELLSTQIAKIGHTPLDAIILVGGFAASEYLYTRVRQAFGAVVPVIVRPQDCDTATLRGAARYGLGLRMGRGAVSSVISPRSYCMKSKLPAEEEDHWRRPEFIGLNDGGTLVCENRLSCASLSSLAILCLRASGECGADHPRALPMLHADLIAKGAVLRKGERLRSRFCRLVRGSSTSFPFSCFGCSLEPTHTAADPQDSIFTAHLFVSDSEELYRYTDEGDLTELCRWTVNLAALPRFHRIAQGGGGYVEFDLGLMLDSAEVRGVLMTEDGIECGAATFEFLGA
ncbi:SPOSA6832_03518, partial [Sporobolomyces salmonicolor]